MRLVAWNLAITLLLFVLVEGAASSLLFFRAVNWQGALAERQHTTYDPDLGWVALPNLTRPDLYGSGVGLTTNDRGFRGSARLESTVPAGKRRIICSGDSFTLGYGVGDDQTWCHLLGQMNPGLETVNMGQGGYGLDQAFLWYRRDGAPLQHHAQIFAFITDDIRRMRLSAFFGYPKPWLEADASGTLVVRNVPVPSAAYGPFSWVIRNLASLRELRTVQLLERVAARMGGQSDEQTQGEVLTPEQTRQTIHAMLVALRQMNDSKRSVLVLVHLPSAGELRPSAPREWAAFMRSEAKSLGIFYVSVADEFRELSAEQRRDLFIQPGQLAYPAAAGHLTPEGNRRTAEVLHTALGEVLSVATVPLD